MKSIFIVLLSLLFQIKIFQCSNNFTLHFQTEIGGENETGAIVNYLLANTTIHKDSIVYSSLENGIDHCFQMKRAQSTKPDMVIQVMSINESKSVCDPVIFGPFRMAIQIHYNYTTSMLYANTRCGMMYYRREKSDIAPLIHLITQVDEQCKWSKYGLQKFEDFSSIRYSYEQTKQHYARFGKNRKSQFTLIYMGVLTILCLIPPILMNWNMSTLLQNGDFETIHRGSVEEEKEELTPPETLSETQRLLNDEEVSTPKI